jgi:tRNA A37 methylthiotransferase MiaB
MAECKKVCHQLHLPMQSGSNRILKIMNRHDDIERYLHLIDYAREKMPDITLTSDIIVGFPGETYEDFCETVKVIKRVGFTSLFTFIYSKREGTPAAVMDDPISREEKGKWFTELLKVQEEIQNSLHFDKPVTVAQVREILADAPGVKLVDDLNNKMYPMPLETSDQDLVFVGRIRPDLTDDCGICLWCCGDQVRKGAATNAVQIAELLVK